MGTQAYFNVARKGPPGGDGTYNDIASRYEKGHQNYQSPHLRFCKFSIRWCFFVEDYDGNPLKDLYHYDYPLYSLIYEAFPCTNDIIDRCGNQGQGSANDHWIKRSLDFKFLIIFFSLDQDLRIFLSIFFALDHIILVVIQIFCSGSWSFWFRWNDLFDPNSRINDLLRRPLIKVTFTEIFQWIATEEVAVAQLIVEMSINTASIGQLPENVQIIQVWVRFSVAFLYDNRRAVKYWFSRT